MKRDQLFAAQDRAIAEFDFGSATAEVFDDMLLRSIPLYTELQRMLGEMAATLAQPGSQLYDLGCSTGTTLATLDSSVAEGVTLVGVDASPAMLAQAAERLAISKRQGRIRLQQADLNDGVVIENASLVLLNLTLQFIRPLRREPLLQQIRAGLRDNGALILVEKVLGNDSLYNRLFTGFYYDMKRRNGYSALEIANKREALENVLVPYRVDENIELLRRNGFTHVEIFFKWYNFAGLLAIAAP